MVKIALFASGSGSNVENIASYFKGSKDIIITTVYTNNPKAGVIDRCQRLGLDLTVFSKDDLYGGSKVLDHLKATSDAIILAGFLWKIPTSLITAFPQKIINIHPALLPKYGGKGMYGMNVHKAVKENNETETGITIHLVNENYDEGAILFQAKTHIERDDTIEEIAQKVHVLEYEYYPKIIEKTLTSYE